MLCPILSLLLKCSIVDLPLTAPQHILLTTHTLLFIHSCFLLLPSMNPISQVTELITHCKHSLLLSMLSTSDPTASVWVTRHKLHILRQPITPVHLLSTHPKHRGRNQHPHHSSCMLHTAKHHFLTLGHGTHFLCFSMLYAVTCCWELLCTLQSLTLSYTPTLFSQS